MNGAAQHLKSGSPAVPTPGSIPKAGMTRLLPEGTTGLFVAMEMDPEQSLKRIKELYEKIK